MDPADKTAKERMRAILRSQPDDSSYDEMLRQLAFQRLVDRGLADVERGEILSTEELRRRIRSW
jgi:predicted transcriptional regulator